MGSKRVESPLAATLIEVAVGPGQVVRAGDVLVVVEAMKMEHELRADADARVVEVAARPGEQLDAGQLLLVLEPWLGGAPDAPPRDAEAAPAPLRADLAELQRRRALTADAARPEAMARRHALGRRSARENVADLCDAGSFVEFGALAVAAQSRRRSAEDLAANTPADGIVCGIGAVDGRRCAVLAYDATVLAGTQGLRGHQKTDRLLQVAHAQRLPVVLFAEGGGGRPGDVDLPVVAGLHVPTFAAFARLSGRVPLIAIVAGRCFAGNAALAGCCDLVVATRDSNLGMGGPAMVEGGGLGVHPPEAIGSSEVQWADGVIDVLVADEAQAVAVARQVLALREGGPRPGWDAPDALALREALPESRLRSYDMRRVLALVADRGSLLELRGGFGLGVHTVLARIEGRPVALLASNPQHLGGAIDPDAADKAARFLHLADAWGLPVLSLVDTPGFMVGPEVEARAQVRHAGRMFVAGAQLRVPVVAVVLRKGYGLGAMAMTGGGFHATLATAAWPSGEFGAMGLEGAVRLGFRKELAAEPEGPAREALFERLLARMIADGSALRMAETLEIDDVIDPAETRAWIANALAAGCIGERAPGGVDPW